MPAEWFVSAIEERLAAAGKADTQVITAEIYQLTPGESTVVIDEMVAGSEFPMVVVGDRVVCTGGVDLQAVLEASTRQ